MRTVTIYLDKNEKQTTREKAWTVVTKVYNDAGNLQRTGYTLGEAQLRAAAPAAGGAAGLTLRDGDTGEKRSFNKNIVKLGRDSACDLVLDLKSDKKKIDKVHATLERREGKWYVIDNSKTGVWVNGQRISSGAPHGLAPGDEIDLAQRKKYIFG